MPDYAPPQESQELQDFSPGREKVKYTLGKMLKWAAIGAVVGGIALAASSALLSAGTGYLGYALAAAGVPMLAVPVVGWVLGGAMILTGAAVALTSVIGVPVAAAAAAATGLMWGAGIGAAIGAISGISGAQDAVEEKREDLMMDRDRSLQRVELANAVRLKHTQQWIEMQNQARGLGLSPQPGLPQGLGAEIGRV